MTPTQTLREQAMKLLAADPTTLAPAADANLVKLVKTNFTPSESLVYGDLDFADFDGSTAIECGTGTQPEGLDPGTADSIIDIKAPAGGFRFETTGVTNLPETIYGYALVNNAEDTLLASGLLDTPITLTAVNQVINLGDLKLT